MPTSRLRPRQTRDILFSPDSITPTSPKLPRLGKFWGSRRNGIWVEGDVADLSRTCRRRNGEVGIVEFGLEHVHEGEMNYSECTCCGIEGYSRDVSQVTEGPSVMRSRTRQQSVPVTCQVLSALNNCVQLVPTDSPTTTMCR